MKYLSSFDKLQDVCERKNLEFSIDRRFEGFQGYKFTIKVFKRIGNKFEIEVVDYDLNRCIVDILFKLEEDLKLVDEMWQQDTY